jgi:hypothetical protein
MSGFLCTMVGATFVTAVAEVIRSKKGVTAVGNAQVDTAQSKFGGASALFDGTGDRLVVSNVSSFNWNTNNWTIEFWVRPQTNNSFDMWAGIWGSDSSLRNMFFGTNSSLNPAFYYTTSSLSTSNITSNDVLSTNTWYHVALVASTNNIKIYVDGVEKAAVGSRPTLNTPTYDFTLGENFSGGDGYNGHIDEVRISNTARYTSTFTPPTAPFVNDANTLLLLHMDGTDASTVFEDDNGLRVKRGITAVGNAQVDTAQSKFGGSSALFDGTGDYLTTPFDSIIDNFSLATQPATIECWVRFNSVSGVQTIMSTRRATFGNFGWQLTLRGDSGTVFEFLIAGVQAPRSTTTASINTWYHVAVTNDGSNLKLWINGNLENTVSIQGTASGSDLRIGGRQANDAYLNGYIDELRVSNTNRYTANFTPATTAFVNDANTLLLIHADGTDASTYFEDDNGVRAKLGISALGNAQVDTAQSKFGGASALFDGTGDYLYSPSVLSLGTGDWTIECWVRPASLQSTVIFDNRSGGSDAAVTTIQSNGTVTLFDGTTSHATSSTYSANTWTHLCWQRSGSTLKIFINGTAGYTNNSHSVNYGSNRNLRIGLSFDNSFGFNGHMDEFRISNTARYATDFTPSTTPFQNDANTLVLLHMDGTDASTVFTDDNGVTLTHNYS